MLWLGRIFRESLGDDYRRLETEREIVMPSRDFFDLYLGMNEDKTELSLKSYPIAQKRYTQSSHHRFSSKATFPHTPLATASSFRILELFPGSGNDVIKMRIQMADWNNPPAYEAVSYCWGDAKDRLICICDGVKLSITRSLYEALMVFRRLGWQTRMLWADAICIDQQNKSELAHQVNNMRKIYQRATGTLIWLGRDECDVARQTFAILHEYAKDIIRVLGFSKDLICQHPDLSDLVEKYAPNHPTNLTWAVDQAKVMAIGKLYKQSWFERLWVMQELNMSSKCSSWWGSTSEDSRWLAFVACCLVNDLDAKTYMQSMTHAQCAATMVRPAGNQTISTSILEIMHATSKFKATDARDRVFALLSMEIFQLLPNRPKIDYDLTKSEVFRQLAEALICSSSSPLDCLSYVGHGHVDLSNRSYSESRTKQEREQIFSPSWVPMWDSNVRQAKSVLRASQMNFDAWPWRHRLPDARGLRLLIQGIIVDEVTSAVRTQESMTGFHPGIKRSYLDTEGVEFWQQLLVDTPRYSGIGITDEVYGATLTLGNAIRISSDAASYHLSDFLAQRFGDKLCFPGWGLRRPRKFIAHDNDMSVVMRLFMRSVADYGTLRLFIRTKTGYIGMGPHVTKAGDAVALLAGSRNPLILRPTSNGQFVVLGDAYVHGIMFGEVFDQMNSGVIPGLEQRQIIIV